MRAFIGVMAILAIATVAQAQLSNGDMETNPGPMYSAIGDWGPNGAWASHAAHPAPGNESLGNAFGFMSVGVTDEVSGDNEIVGQISSWIFQPNTTYVFSGYVMGGGDAVGTAPFQIGYGADVEAGFMLLSSADYAVDGTWTEYAGVSYTTGAAGPEIGQPIAVRLTSDTIIGKNDIWFDSLVLTPEPASVVLLALGGLFLRRR